MHLAAIVEFVSCRYQMQEERRVGVRLFACRLHVDQGVFHDIDVESLLSH